jgi:hypothetical protein
MPLKTIDSEQQLFVLEDGGGFSCLGFEVVRDRTRQYAGFLGASLKEPLPYGTVEALQFFQEIEMRLANSAIARKLTVYDPNTPEDLLAILERVRLNKTRIRLFYGDRNTGRDWNSENDLEGYLGRTTGPIHCPILLASKASPCGGIILSAWIVKVIATASKHTLWQHPGYHSLPFTISDIPSSDPAHTHCPIEVLRAGVVHARFETRPQAARYLRKIAGS